MDMDMDAACLAPGLSGGAALLMRVLERVLAFLSQPRVCGELKLQGGLTSARGPLNPRLATQWQALKIASLAGKKAE
jgi:uncharacterized membrane protein